MQRHGRHLDWEGVFNARDLGGLPAAAGRETRWGAAVRADSLAALTADGWRALLDHGVRTVIDLRNDGERGEDAAPRPASIETVQLPLDVSEDREFWDSWESGPEFGTPLYYGPHLERFPQRNAEVISAFALAAPGGVAFHCVGGRDRSGQLAMVLLALCGVAPEAIVADYLLSAPRLRALYRARGEDDQAPQLEAALRDRGTTAERVIAETLRNVDLEATLSRGGLTSEEIDRARARLLDERVDEAQPRNRLAGDP